MKEKKILPLVISMSLPMVISMAVNSLYNIVDSYFVAIISEDAMTALSLVYPLKYLMTALGVGFGVGIGPFPEMGIAGAAWATGIGQSVCLIAYLLFLKISPIPVNFGQKYISFDRKLLGKLYSVGIPTALNMALPSLLISSLNAILAAFSAKYVLVLGCSYEMCSYHHSGDSD